MILLLGSVETCTGIRPPLYTEWPLHEGPASSCVMNSPMLFNLLYLDFSASIIFFLAVLDLVYSSSPLACLYLNSCWAAARWLADKTLHEKPVNLTRWLCYTVMTSLSSFLFNCIVFIRKCFFYISLLFFFTSCFYQSHPKSQPPCNILCVWDYFSSLRPCCV